MSDKDHIQEIQHLIAELTSSHTPTVRHAIQSLGELSSSDAVDVLITILLGDNWLVVDAAIALGKIGDNRAVDALIQTLHSHEMRAYVQTTTEKAIPKGDWRGAIAIAEHLGEHIGELRTESAHALGKIGDKRAIPDLLTAIRDFSDGYVQEAAYNALGQMRAVDAIPQLIELLADQTLVDTYDPGVAPHPTCNYAAKTLEQIATPDALAAVNEWRTSQTDSTR